MGYNYKIFKPGDLVSITSLTRLELASSFDPISRLRITNEKTFIPVTQKAQAMIVESFFSEAWKRSYSVILHSGLLLMCDNDFLVLVDED